MKKYKSNISNISLSWKPSDIPKVKINTSILAAEYARQFYYDDINIYESFFIILLNRANNTIAWAKISQGGIARTVVDVKLIAKYCIESLASNCILVHNHPSEILIPSDSDKEFTNCIKKTLEMFQCTVLDHIILTKDNHFSFADNEIL